MSGHVRLLVRDSTQSTGWAEYWFGDPAYELLSLYYLEFPRIKQLKAHDPVKVKGITCDENEAVSERGSGNH